MSNETIRIITELDPCQPPEGIAELEPWMAYVGRGGELPEGTDKYYILGNMCGLCSGSGLLHYNHYAVDVRSQWAQKTFPEHCRIRAYVAPSAVAAGHNPHGVTEDQIWTGMRLLTAEEFALLLDGGTASGSMWQRWYWLTSPDSRWVENNSRALCPSESYMVQNDCVVTPKAPAVAAIDWVKSRHKIGVGISIELDGITYTIIGDDTEALEALAASLGFDLNHDEVYNMQTVATKP